MKILPINNYQSNNTQNTNFGAFKIKAITNSKKEVILANISKISGENNFLSADYILGAETLKPINEIGHYLRQHLSEEKLSYLQKKISNVYFSSNDIETLTMFKKADAQKLIFRPVDEMLDDAKIVTMRIVKKALNEMDKQKDAKTLAEYKEDTLIALGLK